MYTVYLERLEGYADALAAFVECWPARVAAVCDTENLSPLSMAPQGVSQIRHHGACNAIPPTLPCCEPWLAFSI